MDNHQLQIILGSIDNKFQIILEGHSSLANQIGDFKQETNERFDLVDFKFKVLNDKIDAVDEKLTKRIDAVAADLKAHRADTEAHGNAGLYVVREGHE